MTEVEAKFVSAIMSISSKCAAIRAHHAVFDKLLSNLEKKTQRGFLKDREDVPDLGAALSSTYYISLVKINTSVRALLPVDDMTLRG